MPTEAPATEPTPEPTLVPTPEPTPEPTEAPVDWSAAYEDYFEREEIVGDKVKVSSMVEQDGMRFGIVVATADENTHISFDFTTVSLDLYATPEKAYSCVEMDGEVIWNWAPVTNEAEVDSMLEMGDSASVDTDSITYVSYREEVTEDGVVYDVLNYVTEDDGEQVEGACYVNRETQKIRRMVMEYEEMPVTVEVEKIESVEIPAEAENATEVTMEDMAETMLGVLVIGALASSDGVEVIDENKSAGNATVTDWSTAYADYFEGEDTLPENWEITAQTVSDGIAFELIMAEAGENARMTYDFGQVVMDVYVMDEVAYMSSNTGTDADSWVYAQTESTVDTDELLGTTDSDMTIDPDDVVTVSYREEVVEDGVTYDVLDVVTEQDGSIVEMTVYVDRETQYIQRMVTVMEGEYSLATVKEIDEIVLPKEAKEATEVTMDEFSDSLLGVFMVGMFSMMGEDAPAVFQ